MVLQVQGVVKTSGVQVAGVLRRRADNLVRFPGPVDARDGTKLTDASGASAEVRIYEHRKRHRIALVESRLRAAVAIAGAAWQIPHFSPQPFEAGDTVEILMDSGQWHQTTIGSVSAGTGPEAPSTNFDTLNVSAGPAVACSAGATIRLPTKSDTATRFPVDPESDQELEIGDEIELETDVIGTFGIATLTVDDLMRRTVATEDGDAAANQESYRVLSVSTLLITEAVSAGRQVRVSLGSTGFAGIAMTEYGTEATWEDTDPESVGGGFEAVIPDTLDLKVGGLVQVEVIFNGGADLKAVSSAVVPVL